MRVMIFIDERNFNANFQKIKKERNQDRFIDYYKINNFVIEYLNNNSTYKKENLRHTRTYVYTGEYAPSLFSKIKIILEKIENEDIKDKLVKILNKAERRREAQKKFFEQCKTMNFLEIRKKPLQFSMSKLGIIQKGVDVQLAVDLVSNAYLDTYDIAALFSGDIDLLESIKTVKNLGKHIITFSHYENMAKEMIRESDMFVDFKHIKDEHLDKFSHIFEKK